MEIKNLINQIKTLSDKRNLIITNLKHEDNDDYYDVFKIETDNNIYIFKKSSEMEIEIYQKILSSLYLDYFPKIYEVINYQDSYYILMEYIKGENLNIASRSKIKLAIEALAAIQNETWNNQSLINYGYNFTLSLKDRINRSKYLNNDLLYNTYNNYLKIYKSIPKALVHDDLLPFNILISKDKAVLIDWEYAGILPFLTSLARLVAHVEEKENSLFYMRNDDKEYAIKYFYNLLLLNKGISFNDYLIALNYFIFYEYTEWIFIGNKNNLIDSPYYNKYSLLAIELANKLKDVNIESILKL